MEDATLITLPEAARRLSCSPSTLRAARDAGELTVYRLGDRWERVRWSEVCDWIRACQVRPTAHAALRVREVLERERRTGT